MQVVAGSAFCLGARETPGEIQIGCCRRAAPRRLPGRSLGRAGPKLEQVNVSSIAVVFRKTQRKAPRNPRGFLELRSGAETRGKSQRLVLTLLDDGLALGLLVL